MTAFVNTRPVASAISRAYGPSDYGWLLAARLEPYNNRPVQLHGPALAPAYEAGLRAIIDGTAAECGVGLNPYLLEFDSKTSGIAVVPVKDVRAKAVAEALAEIQRLRRLYPEIEDADTRPEPEGGEG